VHVRRCHTRGVESPTNLTDLTTALRLAGVREDAYAVEEERDERYCIVSSGSECVIFYSERGSRRDPRFFGQEADASASFYAWVTNDPSVYLAKPS
jgi:hypothetical protein